MHLPSGPSCNDLEIHEALSAQYAAIWANPNSWPHCVGLEPTSDGSDTLLAAAQREAILTNPELLGKTFAAESTCSTPQPIPGRHRQTPRYLPSPRLDGRTNGRGIRQTVFSS